MCVVKYMECTTWVLVRVNTITIEGGDVTGVLDALLGRSTSRCCCWSCEVRGCDHCCWEEE